MEFIRAWQNGDFRLQLFDTFQSDRNGKSILAYRFYHRGSLIFEGSDFSCSPLDAIDSDATVASLLHFFALQKGDTDEEYFADYTEKQMEFSEMHGEDLAMAISEWESTIDISEKWKTATEEALSFFETATRVSSGREETTFVRLREGAPDWVSRMVYAAHDALDMTLLRDWVYESVYRLVASFSEYRYSEAAESVQEIAESLTDDQCRDLAYWLLENTDLASCVDDYRRAIGHSSSIWDDIRGGQGMALELIAEIVFASIDNNINND